MISSVFSSMHQIVCKKRYKEGRKEAASPSHHFFPQSLAVSSTKAKKSPFEPPSVANSFL